MTAELPGFSEDDVESELKDGRLPLSGLKNVTHDDSDDVHASERSYGNFVRTMSKPYTVDIEQITAEFDKGVLHVSMPKTAPKQPVWNKKGSSE